MDPVSKAQRDSANSAKSESRYRGLKPFKKGQSGNPSGRPKKLPITQIYKELLDDPEAREAIKQRMYLTLTGKGMAGVLERREAAERVEGKVTQPIDLALTDLSDEELDQRLERLISKE